MSVQIMARKTSSCGICENPNLPSICPACVNYRLNEYGMNLKSLKSRRDGLYARLSEVLVTKGKADDQASWRVFQNEKLARLKKELKHRRDKLLEGRAKIDKLSNDLKVRDGLLESAMSLLEVKRAEQLEKFFPNLICTQNLGHMAITSELLHKQSVVIKQICKLFPQRRVTVDAERKDGSNCQYDIICNARLPKGLDPHSVPSDELAASLGYMVQLLDLIVRNVCAPSLHNSGFAGSCSRIWQRDSYWDARPSSRSGEYPLFIPRQNFCSTVGEASWYEKSSSNFGVTSMESDRKARLDSLRSSSFSYLSASSHSKETHKELQKGIALVKKSVACITAYCYNILCLDIPAEASTFEAFAKLLATLSSTKEVQSVFSLKMARSRSSKQAQQFSRPAWVANSLASSSAFMESVHALPTQRNAYDPNNRPSSTTASLKYANETSEAERNENAIIEGWDLIEHPTFPPPPSQTEDVEHWTRAMFIDATKK
ncbi:hypothetical protein DM860_017046 [Cuscuta australis]|uniref:UV radiation resistance protein/autophagy-related protein 14 n=1 Tax=Cuscuta australis TaxID=267555 RepID=A0A328DMV7_9ASTE|nr:hypothetical protein DM860_017046 [Cuscuta australis]